MMTTTAIPGRTLHALLLIALIFCSNTTHTDTPNKPPWNAHNAAVSLTYDDALNVHLDTAVPALEARGFRGTFYVTAYAEPFQKRLNDWRQIANNGHELGNHTLFHPCLGNIPNREWVMPHRDLSKWSKQQFLDHVQMTNTVLEAVDGKKQRSFAYTCGDTTAGGESFEEAIANRFIAARGVSGNNQKFTEINFGNLAAHAVANDSAEQLIAQVDNAITNNAWVILLFHGVGGEHSLDVSIKAHEVLLNYLKTKQKTVWVAPVYTVASYAKQAQKPEH
ncbi:polysaccharide deacetylase family protein [Teredinibacter franksiae]|uniref:polysaccharide deacetylase family protein n=1 Tax=Teredinibacter franksiae TaxID=2761453 RepID=UPI001629FF50|nr:polysaccharide deacetylase family protein [Teredinibacter franksiae]